MTRRLGIALLAVLTVGTAAACAPDNTSESSAPGEDGSTLSAPAASGSSEPATSDSTMPSSAAPSASSSDTVTNMTVSETRTPDGVTRFDYSGLGFVLPPGSTHGSPRKQPVSWDTRFDSAEPHVIVSIAWMGDNQVGDGLDLAGVDDVATRITDAIEDNKGTSVDNRRITVAGAREAALLTWADPATTESEEEFPGTDQLTCKLALVLGENNYYYEATYCFAEGDAEAEAATDASLESLAVDVGYPGNRQD